MYYCIITSPPPALTHPPLPFNQTTLSCPVSKSGVKYSVQPFQSSKIAQIGQLTVNMQAVLQAHMALYGYETIETPLIEDADLFLTKAGDQIVEKLFIFERHGRQLALRPEFTAAAVYRYLIAGLSDTVRWQFSGAVFEDHPADGSIQHYSIGAEMIGAKGATADAEIIAMATRGLMAQGITNIQLVIGHVGLMRRLLDRFAIDARTRRFILQHRDLLKNSEHGKAQLLAQLEHYTPTTQNGSSDLAVVDNFTQTNMQQMLGILLDSSRRAETMGGRTQAEIAERLVQKHQQNSEHDQISAALDFLAAWIAISEAADTALSQAQDFIEDDAEAGRMLAEWREIILQLRAYGIPLEQVVIQPDLARTWDYYTGVVFELRTTNGLQIGGGGRYDELARLIGGEQNIPAVGFAYYVDSLLTILPQTSINHKTPVYIRPINGNNSFAVRWADQLRANGLSIVMATGDTSPVDSLLLYVENNGDLRFNQQTYTPDQLASIITAINEAYGA